MSTVHHQEYLNNVYTKKLFVIPVLLAPVDVVRIEHPDHAWFAYGAGVGFSEH